MVVVVVVVVLTSQRQRQRLREEEIDRTCMTSDKLGSPLDPLLASLAHFHSSADLSEKARFRVATNAPARPLDSVPSRYVGG